LLPSPFPGLNQHGQEHSSFRMLTARGARLAC
jgi:hypothetical protein